MKSITVIKTDDRYPTESEKIIYCVNDACEGLFIETHGEFRQTLGTCQFWASSPKQFIRKLRAMMQSNVSIKMVRGSAEGF